MIRSENDNDQLGMTLGSVRYEETILSLSRSWINPTLYSWEAEIC
jgi:hypothetical protein